MIKSIFEISLGTAEFTHVPGHSVSGITLPPDDATFIFITFLACSRVVKKTDPALIYANDYTSGMYKLWRELVIFNILNCVCHDHPARIIT